jgi:hypothetical protein
VKKYKAKGTYWFPRSEKDYDGVWNKDFSNMSRQKITEQCLLTGVAPEDIIRLVTNKFDFMLRYKTPGGSKVYIGGREMLKTVRYYVSLTGEPMRKVTPAKGVGFKRKNKLTNEYFNKILSEIPEGTWDARIHTGNKSVYKETVTSIESGYLVRQCNNASNFNFADLDYSYYLAEIRKLII